MSHSMSSRHQLNKTWKHRDILYYVFSFFSVVIGFAMINSSCALALVQQVTLPLQAMFLVSYPSLTKHCV